MSISKLDSPSAMASRNPSMVFSGNSPRAPRWPCRSNMKLRLRRCGRRVKTARMDDRQPGGGKILGVLGGMGPLASAQFMLRLTLLTPAERDQDHIPAVLWSDPRVPDRTAARLGTGPDPLP